MSSWSDKRAPEEKRSPEDIRRGIAQVNAVLKKLSLDSDLTDDLKDPMVNVAIKHWTNEKRLSPEDANNLLEDNYRVVSVLQKMHILQHSCQQLGVPVPIDHLLLRQKCLSDEIVKKYFGEDYVVSKAPALSKESTTSVKRESKRAKSDKTEQEFGPQLPPADEQLTPEEEALEAKLTQIINWGKEPMGSEGFSWFKLVVRSMGEVCVVALFAVLATWYMGSKNEVVGNNE